MSDAARILVVDDDATIRKLISSVLAQEGYLVDTASSAAEAIAKSNVQLYSMALIDIRLPDIQGTKLLSLLRDTEPKMIKVIVTGYPALENAMETISRGVDAYLTKPVSPDTLIATVRELFRKRLNETEFTEERLRAYLASRFKEAKTNRRAIGEAATRVQHT